MLSVVRKTKNRQRETTSKEKTKIYGRYREKPTEPLLTDRGYCGTADAAVTGTYREHPQARCVGGSDETTQLYWNVGNAVNTFVLQGSRAEYGKQIVVSVSRQLIAEYGDSFEEKKRSDGVVSLLAGEI